MIALVEKNKKILGEMIRFAVVGLLATALHYGLYWILVHQINVNIAYAVGYALSWLANYFMTSLFTFHTMPSLRNGVGFGMAHLVNFLLQMDLLNLFIIGIGINKEWAPLPVYAISIPINFLLVRFVFKRNKYTIHSEKSNNPSTLL